MMIKNDEHIHYPHIHVNIVGGKGAAGLNMCYFFQGIKLVFAWVE